MATSISTKGRASSRHIISAHRAKRRSALLDKTVERLIQQSLDANRKAKGARGALKQLFYDEKTRCIRRAIELAPEDFFISEVSSDRLVVGISSYQRLIVHVPLNELRALVDARWQDMIGWADTA